jgi:uncharacterized peroxidase-related enzyme
VVHHGGGLFRLTKDQAFVDRIASNFREADITANDLAMLSYAEKLTVTPSACASEDVEQLRDIGFNDADILDIVQVTAYFNYVNRIADGLGIELEPYRENE